MIKKEKTVEGLLFNYRNNKAEINMLSYGLDLKSVRYDNVNVQTSNKRDLSDITSKREEILEGLKQDVYDTECLLSSLGDRDRFIIESFYIKRLTRIKIANELNLTTEDAVNKAKANILKRLREFYKRILECRGIC